MKTTLRIISVVLLVFLGLGGIYGALMLISDPSGGKFGWPAELLEATPFSSYLIPGIVLMVFIGILPLLVAVLTILKRRIAPWLIIIQGVVLIGWLSIELLLNPEFFLPEMHYPSYATGLLLTIMGGFLLFKLNTIQE